MKIGDIVKSTTHHLTLTGKIVAILADNTGIVDVDGHRIYANFNYWVKVDE